MAKDHKRSLREYDRIRVQKGVRLEVQDYLDNCVQPKYASLQELIHGGSWCFLTTQGHDPGPLPKSTSSTNSSEKIVLREVWDALNESVHDGEYSSLTLAVTELIIRPELARLAAAPEFVFPFVFREAFAEGHLEFRAEPLHPDKPHSPSGEWKTITKRFARDALIQNDDEWSFDRFRPEVEGGAVGCPWHEQNFDPRRHGQPIEARLATSEAVGHIISVIKRKKSRKIHPASQEIYKEKVPAIPLKQDQEFGPLRRWWLEKYGKDPAWWAPADQFFDALPWYFYDERYKLYVIEHGSAVPIGTPPTEFEIFALSPEKERERRLARLKDQVFLDSKEALLLASLGPREIESLVHHASQSNTNNGSRPL